MNCISTYKCLSDETRLRILNLLQTGPLCVCHVQEALELPQSKISKQLAYLKKNGLLTSRRLNNWTIYEIPSPPNPLLAENLRVLQTQLFNTPEYKKDQSRLAQLDTSIACAPSTNCCS